MLSIPHRGFYHDNITLGDLSAFASYKIKKGMYHNIKYKAS